MPARCWICLHLIAGGKARFVTIFPSKHARAVHRRCAERDGVGFANYRLLESKWQVVADRIQRLKAPS